MNLFTPRFLGTLPPFHPRFSGPLPPFHPRLLGALQTFHIQVFGGPTNLPPPRFLGPLTPFYLKVSRDLSIGIGMDLETANFTPQLTFLLLHINVWYFLKVESQRNPAMYLDDNETMSWKSKNQRSQVCSLRHVSVYWNVGVKGLMLDFRILYGVFQTPLTLKFGIKVLKLESFFDVKTLPTCSQNTGNQVILTGSCLIFFTATFNIQKKITIGIKKFRLTDETLFIDNPALQVRGHHNHTMYKLRLR